MRHLRAILLTLLCALTISPAFAQTYRLTPTPKQVILVNGVPANGAKIYTYAAGSLTPIDTYSNRTGTLNTNPIVADADGRWVAYLLTDTAYKFVATTSDGTAIWTQDYVQIDISGSDNLSPTYTAKTANYTAVANDFVAATSGTFTVTLPLASANANKTIWVVNNGTGTTTVGRTGSDTIGLATSQTLNPGATSSFQGDSMTFISDGVSNWNIF